MNAKPPSDQAEKIVVRLPDGMRDLLAKWAKYNSRSVNAEVVARLQQSLDPRINANAKELALMDEDVRKIEEAHNELKRMLTEKGII